MGIRSIVLAGALLAACGSPQYQSYEPVEFDLESRATTFAQAREIMRGKDLRILEEDESHGLLSTQWQKHGAQHYNVQVIMSPVRAVVHIGCRVEKSMEIHECKDSSTYPSKLVKLARGLTKELR